MYLLVAAVTGARRSELVALRWPDIDLSGPSGAVLVIGRGVVAGPSGLVEKDTKTHQVRKVSLDAMTAARLREHRERTAAVAKSCATTVEPNGFVFSHDPTGGTPWYPDSVSRQFKRYCAKAGMDGVRLHDLRRYVASQLLVAGVAGVAGVATPAQYSTSTPSSFQKPIGPPRSFLDGRFNARLGVVRVSASSRRVFACD